MRLHPADINIYPAEVSILYTRNFEPADWHFSVAMYSACFSLDCGEQILDSPLQTKYAALQTSLESSPLYEVLPKCHE